MVLLKKFHKYDTYIFIIHTHTCIGILENIQDARLQLLLNALLQNCEQRLSKLIIRPIGTHPSCIIF